MRWDFDLSRNKSLRTLEITAESMVSVDTVPNFLGTVLSTITSSLPLNVIIIYWYPDICEEVHKERLCGARLITPSIRHAQRFKEFHKMYTARKFQLVLCAYGRGGGTMELAIQGLKRIINRERARGGLDYLDCEPLITSEMHSSSPCYCYDDSAKPLWFYPPACHDVLIY